jgi:hypothetical protein
MDALHWSLLAMLIMALLVGVRESNRKLEYWRYWQEMIEHAARLETRLAAYEGDDEEDENSFLYQKKPRRKI